AQLLRCGRRGRQHRQWLRRGLHGRFDQQALRGSARMSSKSTAWLAIENGTVLKGGSVGAEGEAGGDLVFNTAMTGYHEILTDPSYAGQVVIMTYPLIGNYGIAEEDAESGSGWAEAFVMREMSTLASSHRASM